MTDFADTFGDLVRQYISQHCLSYQDFAITLGFKSKTSISRIIQNETSYELRAQFFTRLSKAYPLTAQEEYAFRETLRVSRLSESDQTFFRCFNNLIHADFDLERQNDIAYQCLNQSEPCSLRSLLADRSADSYLITASVFGLPSTSFIAALYKLLSENNCSFSIHHFVFTGEGILPQLRSITDSAPLFFDPRYKIHYCRANADRAMLDNHLIIHYALEDGTSSEDFFLLDRQKPMVYNRPMNSSFSELYHRYFLSAEEPALSIKSEYMQTAPVDQLHAFISTQSKIIELEEDCAVFSLKKGLSIEFIPPEIFKNALQSQYLPEQDTKKAIANLLRIQKKRHQHLLARKKPLQYLLSPNAFQRFIWTGRLGNHPAFLRSFSPRERLETLTLIIQQLQHNPYFSIHFASDDLPPVYNYLTLTCYHPTHYTSAHQEKHGGLLIQSSLEFSSYAALVMLSDNGLASSFSQFFREELCPRYAEPAKTTMRFLYNMLEYLQTKLA